MSANSTCRLQAIFPHSKLTDAPYGMSSAKLDVAAQADPAVQNADDGVAQLDSSQGTNSLT